MNDLVDIIRAANEMVQHSNSWASWPGSRRTSDGRGRRGGCVIGGDTVVVSSTEQAPIREDLFALFDVDELEKYYTAAELTARP